MNDIAHWIGGKAWAGPVARWGDVYNPATGRVMSRVALADAATVDRAVDSAERAFRDWRHASLAARSRVLFAFRELVERHKQEIAGLLTAEHGKVASDALGEVNRGLDRATFRVLGNETLLALAERQPKDRAGLQGIPGLSSDGVARRGDELLAAIAEGLAADPDSVPTIERGRRPLRDPEFDALVERLKAVRNAAAQRLDLATGVLCPNATVEGIARIKAKSSEEMRTVPGIRRWQVEVLGEEFLRVLVSADSRSAG